MQCVRMPLTHLERLSVLALLLAQHAEIVRHLADQRVIATVLQQPDTTNTHTHAHTHSIGMEPYPPYIDSSFCSDLR